MNRICRQTGIPFVVFHIFEENLALRRLLADLGRREDFPVLEVFPSRDARYAKLDLQRFRNSMMDSHPNVEGNQMWAELLRDALRGHLDPGRF